MVRCGTTSQLKTQKFKPLQSVKVNKDSNFKLFALYISKVEKSQKRIEKFLTSYFYLPIIVSTTYPNSNSTSSMPHSIIVVS